MNDKNIKAITNALSKLKDELFGQFHRDYELRFGYKDNVLHTIDINGNDIAEDPYTEYFLFYKDSGGNWRQFDLMDPVRKRFVDLLREEKESLGFYCRNLI